MAGCRLDREARLETIGWSGAELDQHVSDLGGGRQRRVLSYPQSSMRTATSVAILTVGICLAREHDRRHFRPAVAPDPALGRSRLR